MSRSLISKLEDLGACRTSKEWCEHNEFRTAQEAWDSEDVKPKDMLWILRRTMGKSDKRRRALALLAIELLDLSYGDEWYKPSSIDEGFRTALLAYGKGTLSFEGLYAIKQEVVFTGHRGWTQGVKLFNSLESYEFEWDGAIDYQGLLFHPGPGLFAEQQALIRKHFPKPPRLS